MALISILLIAMILFIVYNRETTINEKQIIAEDSSINWAWRFSYSGTIICNDGSVYKFSMIDKRKEYDESYKDINKLNKCILNNTTELVCKISKKEIKKLKNIQKILKMNIIQKIIQEEQIGDKLVLIFGITNQIKE